MNYIITEISRQKPKPWNDIFYVNVKVKEHDKPISVGKKDPTTLRVGDTLHGTITPTDLPSDRFKAEQPTEQEKPSEGSYWAEKDKAIRAQWAIGQAVQLNIATGKMDSGKIEEHAKALFSMVDRVKLGENTSDDFDKEVLEEADRDIMLGDI